MRNPKYKENIKRERNFAKAKETKRWSEEERGGQRIERGHGHVPTAHEECKQYALQTRTNKKHF